jgi:hypothetical protein
MAKEQHMSINTMKISGVCGRLMCCLAYENAREASRESRESPENPENPENVVEFVENEEDGGLIPVTGDLGAGSKTRFSGRVVGPEAGPGEGDSRSPNGSNASGRRRERRRENDWNARRGLDDRKDGKERESRVETLDPETPAAGVSGKVDGDEAG